MFIAEKFHSIQGEGVITGVPSVFIQTSGCDRRCVCCDTNYASWQPEGEHVSIADIFQRVTAFPSEHCMLTGGEPLVAARVGGLAAELRSAGKHITIATAGTVQPTGIACDFASIGQKLSNSTPPVGAITEEWRSPHDKVRLQPAVLREWIDAYACQFKFAVETAADLAEIE